MSGQRSKGAREIGRQGDKEMGGHREGGGTDGDTCGLGLEDDFVLGAIEGHPELIQHVSAEDALGATRNGLDEGAINSAVDLDASAIHQGGYTGAKQPPGQTGQVRSRFASLYMEKGELNRSKARQSDSGRTERSAPVSGMIAA